MDIVKTQTKNKLVKASDWFAGGMRNFYSPTHKEIVDVNEAYKYEDLIKVFRRIKNDNSSDSKWLSFLPGFPDGSYGWSQVEQLVKKELPNPLLFPEYVGQGDSDKPENYDYSTFERANLVEAQWRSNGIKETFIVTFDYSSLVALELLSRYEKYIHSNQSVNTIITGVLMINGGLFADAHSHPFMTTPLLKTRVGKAGARFAQKNRTAFDLMMKGLWSKDYAVTKEELGEVYHAISRRNGAVFMSNAARFVDEHKLNAQRWDLQRLFLSLHSRVKFYVVGSEEDPFEYKQIIAARERLGSKGLLIKKIPGGHMTTSEKPELIAEIIFQTLNK